MKSVIMVRTSVILVLQCTDYMNTFGLNTIDGNEKDLVSSFKCFISDSIFNGISPRQGA